LNLTRFELIAIKERHEREGLGYFVLDPDLAFSQEYGVELWFAPCGCTLSIPVAEQDQTGDFSPARDHLVRLAPVEVRREAEQAVKENASRAMRNGVLWLLGGGIASGISFVAVPPEGGRYFIFAGAIVFGMIMFLRGLWYYLRPRQLLSRMR
jgi:hypothetical protein